MDKAADGAFALRTEESVRNALRELQEFAGLPASGRMDERTKKLLHTLVAVCQIKYSKHLAEGNGTQFMVKNGLIRI